MERKEIIEPILLEMDAIYDYLSSRPFLPMKEFDELVRRHNLLSVRLAIVRKW